MIRRIVHAGLRRTRTEGSRNSASGKLVCRAPEFVLLVSETKRRLKPDLGAFLDDNTILQTCIL